MAASTGYILAAAGVTLANEAIFAPIVEGHKGDAFQSVNWRIVPATALVAIAFAGLEQIAPPFAKGLAVLVLVVAVVLPFGNAPSPIENASKLLGTK